MIVQVYTFHKLFYVFLDSSTGIFFKPFYTIEKYFKLYTFKRE